MTDRFHTSVTERQDFRGCRRRWYLGVHENLQTKAGVTWYLIFGDCWHAGMDAYYRPKTSRSSKPPRDISLAIDAFDEAWELEDLKLREMYAGLYSNGIEEEWNMHRDRGHEMLKYYNLFDKAHPLFNKVIEVGVEERAWVDILGPGGEHLPELPLLSGRIDLVVERENGIFIVDHKALASMANDKALDLDDQLTGYSYIWWRLTGSIPQGAFYNVAVKDPPKVPRVLKNGTLSQDKSQRTTMELFRAALKEMGVKGSIQKGPAGETLADYSEYIDMLSQKGWHQFYQRLGPVRKSREQLESFERYLYYEYLDMEAARKDENLRYGARSQYVCPGCPYQMISQAMEDQGNVDLVIQSGYKRTDPRVVIPAEIADPKWKGV